MSKSCYVLELSVVPGEARRGELFVATSTDAIQQRLTQEFQHPNPEIRIEAAYMAAWYGETIVLWIVEQGMLVGGVDLHPFLRLRIGSMPPIRLDDENTLNMLRQRFPDPMQILQSGAEIAVEVDAENLTKQLPPLEGAPLLPGETLRIERNVNQLRQLNSYLAQVDTLKLGYRDVELGEEGGPALELEAEPAAPARPAPPPQAPSAPPPAPPPPAAPVVAGPAITAVEHKGRLIAHVPQERFTARLADQLKSRAREALQPGDAFSRPQRERLEREGCGFVAPLEFFSEVELEGKPLDRKKFEALAKELAPGLRGLEVHLPRFGTVTVLDWKGKRFVTSEAELDPQVLEGW